MKSSTAAPMPEVRTPQSIVDAVALGRFLIRRQGKWLSFCMALACTGPIGLVLVSTVLDPEWMTATMEVTVVFTQLPLLILSLVALDFAGTRLEVPGTLLDRFVMRSPASTRVIAWVVWVGKAIAIAFWMLSLIVSMATASMLLDPLTIVEVYVGLLGIGWWFSAIVWRPFRWEVNRVVVGLVAFFACCLMGFLIPNREIRLEWYRVSGVAWPPVVSALLALAVGWRGIRSARAERPVPSSNPSASAWDAIHLWLSRDSAERGHVASRGVTRELRFFDRRRIAGLSFVVSLFFVPLLLLVVIDSMAVGILMTILFVHMIAAITMMGGWGDLRSGGIKSGHRRTLDLIAISPISLTQLCRIKIIRCVSVSFLSSTVMGMGCVVVIWLSGQAAVWQAWALSVSELSETFEITGTRVCLTLWLIASISVFGIAVGNLWIQFFSRDRIVTALLISFHLLAAGIVAFGLFRLITLNNYDAMIAMRDQLFRSVPGLVTTLLLFKLAVLPIALRTAIRQPAPDRFRWVGQVMTGWLVTLGVVWVTVQAIWPSLNPSENPALSWLAHPTPWQWLILISVLLPCSRLLTLPWALATDIHR
ncbi:MAG: hypothetical protein AAGJ83_00945 [Planctomycetota bacterium]